MKEIKAYVQRDRVAEVIAALKNSDIWGGERGDAKHGLAVYLVRGLVPSPFDQDRHYSTDLGDEVVKEYKLEFVCEDGEAQALVELIAKSAHTGAPGAGWITVSTIDQAMQIR